MITPESQRLKQKYSHYFDHLDAKYVPLTVKHVIAFAGKHFQLPEQSLRRTAQRLKDMVDRPVTLDLFLCILKMLGSWLQYEAGGMHQINSQLVRLPIKQIYKKVKLVQQKILHGQKPRDNKQFIQPDKQQNQIIAEQIERAKEIYTEQQQKQSQIQKLEKLQQKQILAQQIFKSKEEQSSKQFSSMSSDSFFIQFHSDQSQQNFDHNSKKQPNKNLKQDQIKQIEQSKLSLKIDFDEQSYSSSEQERKVK